jgi:ketosteroid isomerase-like protein
MDQSTLVAEYYRCLDDDEYETLRSILHPEFVQHRPDRSFESRDEFVEFMKTGRPKTETTHRVDRLLESKTGLAAAGRLFDSEGSELFEFIDVFRVENDRILAVDTFS